MWQGHSASAVIQCLSRQSVVNVDQMLIAALEGELSLSRDDDSAAIPPLGVVVLSKPDPEMTAMFSWAGENVGLVWNPPPFPDPLRLDKWFPWWRSHWFSAPPSGTILP